jgi:ribose 5-phosphate isomerase B
MRIAVAADHAGFRYKQMVAEYLRRRGHDLIDFGTVSEEPVDYPDLIVPAARAVASGEVERGVVFGGSGNGEAMAANRLRGVRCGLAWSTESARLTRAHNDANMLAIGQRLLTPEQTLAIIDVWLDTPFDGGRHVVRVQKLDRATTPA